jgi:hypothetical protein
MALKNPSLILYGYNIDVSNQYIDFQNSSGGPILTAVLEQGNFSLSDLISNIVSALGVQDAVNTYTVTADRTIAGGTQNRVTISTNGIYLKILFGSGPNAAASVASTIGFLESDYSGHTTYTGAMTSGISIQPTYTGYNWVAPTRNRKLFGAVNVSAAGVKQAIVFQLQQFFEVEFRYETESRVDAIWQPFMDWAAQQFDLEFTPDITQPETFYNCTLESTESDDTGLGWMMSEMLPEYPFLYQTGKLKFRIILIPPTFINPVA